MIELAKYFRILFMSFRISRERLKAIAEDHLLRLAENNPANIFDDILADAEAKTITFSNDLTALSVKESQKEGKTITLEKARTNIETNLSENNDLVSYTYRNDADKYEELYPQGMTEYYQADLPTLKTITFRYREILENRAADFPPAFVAAFNGFQTAFVNALNASSTAKGGVSGGISDIATSRPALARQLTVNLLTIALEYVGDESKAGVYFDQAMIDAAFREGSRKVTSEINPAETQNIFDNVTKADVRISIKNTGESTLNFGFKPEEGSTVADTMHTLEPGQEITLSAAELGWTSDNSFLNVTSNGELAGSYVAEKV